MNCSIGNIAPWYLLMWREICTHQDIVIKPIQAVVTCETTQYCCVDCNKLLAEITDCA